MVNFIVYDVAFLILFTLFVIFFLYTRKHNLKREGLIYLYRTQWGVKAIERTANKYRKILNGIKYLVILSGFILMISIIILLVFTLIVYFQQPDNSPIAKVPAVFPLIPYFPQLFGLQSFFPPFFFAYFIIGIAIIAISHEFAHGIFARLFKVKIKSTGFAFLGPFLGAFVEQDDKQMNKTTKLQQMTILAAGTFANVVMMILFGILLVLFFKFAFTPAGFVFDSYAISPMNLSDVSAINGVPIQQFNLSSISANLSLIPLTLSNSTFHTSPLYLKYSLENNLDQVIVYDDAPAFNAKLPNVITEIDFTKITTQEELSLVLSNHNPGDTIEIKAIDENLNEKSYEITLAERSGVAYLGIASYPSQGNSILSKFYNIFGNVKNSNTYYTSNFGDFSQFIYDLLWWVVMLNFLVALFNMYPAGILDGGRFLMLAIWGITGSKKFGEYSLKFMTWLLLILVGLMMIRWVFAFI